MTKGQIIFCGLLIAFSMLVVIGSLIWIIRKTIMKKHTPEKFNKAGISTALVFSGCLIVAIWILRFAVGYFALSTAGEGVHQLTLPEEIINGLFGALRTFSLEEEYAEYIVDIKNLISEIIPNELRVFPAIQFVTVMYASLLNLVAPIIGGAIILEILSSIFPKVKLIWSYYINFRRPKYFFSELNAASLSLAKSIYYEKKAQNKEKSSKSPKPIMIFTDTYIDEENEKEYELLVEAKQYGAICVRDDLAHIAKPKYGKCEYYLMDENEFSNLQTLMKLYEDNNVKFIKNSNIYLFVQSDAYVQLEKQLNKELEKAGSETKGKRRKSPLKAGERPIIIPIYGYRNLVHNLFVDVPLYEPLINKKDNTKLNVTILGNGAIGTEAFLSAYWFGQMLINREVNGQKTTDECELTINVVSKDEKEVFWSKIDYINPEIKETVRISENGSECKESKLLEYDDNGNKNNPYCNVEYIKADVKIGGFWDSDSEEVHKLLGSDYFIIALGNDADNISVANKLRRLIGKKHLEETQDDAVGNVIIAYAVFNSGIAAKLNSQRHYSCRIKERPDIYMYAFGSLDSVYSCNNVYMSRYKLLAEVIGASYDKSQAQRKLMDDNNDRKYNENNNYNYWANLARTMHIKYKVFSLGLINKSIFDYNSDATDAYKAYIKTQCRKYIEIALAESPQDFCGDIADIYKDIQLKKHLLAWLEHRRWNAFTRTMGYQHISAENIFNVKNIQKDMELKLHSCLVEARRPHLVEGDTYIYADFMANGLVDKNTTFRSFPTKQLDRLDQVSYERKKRRLTEPVEDFKMYDYYRYEFYEYFGTKELERLLKQVEFY